MRFANPFTFGTKADTLHRLAPFLTTCVVPESLHFAVADWESGDRDRLLAAITARFSPGTVIVRSSADGEDGATSTLAGAFCSVPKVPAEDPEALAAAVDTVVASYGRHATGGAERDLVLVQEMITSVEMSGVLFTQDINTGAPYYVINYDDESGDTTTVTGGCGYANRTLYVYRDRWHELESERFHALITAVREVEAVTGDPDLDVEFAVDRDNRVHIFQVRRITTQRNWNRGQALRIADALGRLEEALADRFSADPKDDFLGSTVLGNMPDWNPAEMIGITPRPLAFSLYRRLITDQVWRTARRDMGYREQRGMPLMMSLAGQPYIDVRESMLSYLPASLPTDIGDRLVESWVDRLRLQPHLHDKVEFEVAITAFTPDFDRRVDQQSSGVLSDEDRGRFRNELRNLTNDLLLGRRASIPSQLQLVQRLSVRREETIRSHPVPRFEAVTQLLEDATELGTTPFAVLARHAFVATAILRGLVAREAISPEQAEAFQRSIPTVATEFIADVDRHARGAMDEQALLERYGHLRPGTYDICSVRYDGQWSGVAPGDGSAGAPAPGDPPLIGPTQRADIDSLLRSEGYEIDAAHLFEYIRDAIQGREHAKFVFSRNVSDALEVIAALGERHGLSRDELSYVDIRHFLDCFVEPDGRSIESELRSLSDRGRAKHQITAAVRLPSLLTRRSDLWIIPLMVEQPNFVTRGHASGDVVLVDGALSDPSVIDGRIVAISSADPGFDWIFTRPIRGLVTRFGGTNSHMAIRCAEFALPAAIGCGEQIFERLVEHGRVDLNCAEGKIALV